MEIKDIKQSVKVLKKILNNSSVGGKDTKKFWIIDKKEEQALRVVIDLLNDLI